jgi:hypothetical protein
MNGKRAKELRRLAPPITAETKDAVYWTDGQKMFLHPGSSRKIYRNLKKEYYSLDKHQEV